MSRGLLQNNLTGKAKSLPSQSEAEQSGQGSCTNATYSFAASKAEHRLAAPETTELTRPGVLQLKCTNLKSTEGL